MIDLADRLVRWANSLCTVPADDPASILDALGFGQPARAGASYVEIEAPIPGVDMVVLVRDHDPQRIRYVNLELAQDAALGLGAIESMLGSGDRGAAAPSGHVTVTFEVRQAGAPRRCSLLAEFEPGALDDLMPRTRKVTLCIVKPDRA